MKNPNRKSIILFFISLIFLPQLIFSAADEIAALVNDEVITQSDVEELSKLYNELPKDKALLRLIQDRLIIQEARQRQIKIEQELIEDKLRMISQEAGSEDKFQNALSSEGLTEIELKKRIEEQLLIKRLLDWEVRSKVSVLPGEITEYYELHKSSFEGKELLEVQDEIKGLLWEMKAKVEFARFMEGLRKKAEIIIKK